MSKETFNRGKQVADRQQRQVCKLRSPLWAPWAPCVHCRTRPAASALISTLKCFTHPSFSLCPHHLSPKPLPSVAYLTQHPTNWSPPRALLPPQLSEVVVISLLWSLNLKPHYGVPLLLGQRLEPTSLTLPYTLSFTLCSSHICLFL